LAYNGKNYNGWQVQPGMPTVQGELNQKLSLVLKEPINVIGAGRTDSGVHASYFVAHFDCSRDGLHQEANFLFKINEFLSKDIVIHTIQKVNPGSHARFSAISRTYKYYITRLKDPFRYPTALHLHGSIDMPGMKKASELLLEHTDFTAFSKMHSDNKTTICHIYQAEWTEKENELIFTIKADRFLRGMVRLLVGGLIEVGQGKKTVGDFRMILESGNRNKTRHTVPAKALFLTSIGYPTEVFKNG
jgi:tRNA pseudouridine38-40 synthase